MDRETGRQTFAEIADGWVFCGLRLLRHRWERCRAIAETEAQRRTCRQMLDKYLEQMAADRSECAGLGRPTEVQDGVLARGDAERYFGDLLHNRFRVAEGLSPAGTFYLIDYRLPDLVVREGGPASETWRFKSVEEAERRAGILFFQPMETTVAKSATEKKSREVNGVAPFEEAPRLSVAATGERSGADKAGKKSDVKPAKTEKPAAITKPAKTKEPAAERKSASGMFKQLIMAGKLTDDQIFAEVQKEFGLEEKQRTYVKWYRNDLSKKGMNPPGPIGGPPAKTKVAPTLVDAKTAKKIAKGIVPEAMPPASKPVPAKGKNPIGTHDTTKKIEKVRSELAAAGADKKKPEMRTTRGH